MATFQLVEIGRSHVTREVTVTSWRALLREVKKHLMSRDVDVSDEGIVFVGGWRNVGRVEPLDNEAIEWLPLWTPEPSRGRSAP